MNKEKKDVILLLGMTASGKTTIGRALSHRLKCRWIDMDEKIKDVCNLSVRSFYAIYGKKAFRQKESEVLQEVFDKWQKGEIAEKKGNEKHLVISCGGGLLENQEALDFLSSAFSDLLGVHIFLLEMPEKILWKRVLHKARKNRAFPAFLTQGNDEHFHFHKETKKVAKYRANFLLLCKQRRANFAKMERKLAYTRLKCKGKKISKLTRLMRNKI